MDQDGERDALKQLAEVLDQLSGATRDLPDAIAAARLALDRQPVAPAPAPADPLVLVIDTRVQGYLQAMSLVRQAYDLDPGGAGGVRVHTVPGEVIWRQVGGTWIQHWDKELLQAFVGGLEPQALLAAWRLSMTPGVRVGAAELGAFIVPGGTTKEQLTAANVAIRQGNAHCRRDVEAYGGMPFTKSYLGRRNAGPVSYTADAAVAPVLMDAIRRSPLYPQLRRMQPALPEVGEDGPTGAGHGR